MTVRLPAGRTLADGPFPTLIEHSGYQIAAPNDLLQSVINVAERRQRYGRPARARRPARRSARSSPRCWASPSSACRCAARAARAAPSTSSTCRPPTTATTWSRRSPPSPGSRATRSGWRASRFSGITPAVRRRHAAAAPRRHRPDVGDRRHLLRDRVPRRHPQLRLRRVLDRGAHGRRPARPGGRPAVRAGARARGRPALRGQPGAAPADRGRAARSSGRNPYRTPSLYAQRSPSTWMDRIDVPTFLVGQFQDEQTGGHFVRSLGALARNRQGVAVAAERRARRLAGARHDHALGRVPQALRRRRDPGGARARPVAERRALRVPRRGRRVARAAVALRGHDRRRGRAARPSSATRACACSWTTAPARRARARSARPGSSASTPGRSARCGPTPYYLGARGTLGRASRRRAGHGRVRRRSGRATGRRRCRATARPTRGRRSRPTTGAPVAAGKGVGFTSARAAARRRSSPGSSSLDLHLRSSARDTDLQVTLSEVRPDGRETYVQNGWLRASHRKLDRRASTALDPVPTHLRQDAAPLPRGALRAGARADLPGRRTPSGRARGSA